MKALLLTAGLIVAASSPASALYCGGGMGGAYNKVVGVWVVDGQYSCAYENQGTAATAIQQLVKKNSYFIQITGYLGGSGTWSGCEGAARSRMTDTTKTYFFGCIWPHQ